MKKLSLKSKVLKNFDKLIDFYYKYLVVSLLRGMPPSKRLYIVGGGKTREKVYNKDFSDSEIVALLNYTSSEHIGRVDFLLMSDHFMFSLKNLIKTIRHISTVKPLIIILPTRAIFSLCGLYCLLFRKTIFVRYYGEPVWEFEKFEKKIDLNSILPSYDTVAFEFGFPLAHSLKVSDVVLAGVDLTYNDDISFRTQWKLNINKSIQMTVKNMGFKIYKIHDNTYGDFPVIDLNE